MPDFRLTERDIEDITAFLKNMDATGKSDSKTFTINYDGPIEQ